MKRPMMYDKTLADRLSFDKDVRMFRTNGETYKTFLSLHNEIFKTSTFYRLTYRFEVFLESIFMLKNRHFIVKDSKNTIIGIFTISEKGNNSIWIYNVGVVADMRNKGYATSFLSKVLLFYLDKPEKIFLTVNTNNKKAVNLYSKLGFRFLQRRRKNEYEKK